MFRSLIKTRQHLLYCTRSRLYCDGSPAVTQLTEREKQILGILQTRFPKANEISVADISGGCGAMYQIQIESEDFRGIKTVKQHQMVTDALKSEIKEMHGLQITTRLPG